VLTLQGVRIPPDFDMYLVINKCVPIPVATRSKKWVCGRSLVGIVGSYPLGGGGAGPFCLLWFVRKRSLRRADHLSRGVLSIMVCLSMIVKSRHRGGPNLLGAVALLKKNSQ
jgi:hypothetical protein